MRFRNLLIGAATIAVGLGGSAVALARTSEASATTAHPAAATAAGLTATLFQFDPGDSDIVLAQFLPGQGVPESSDPNAPGQALYLGKNGPTATNASAGAVLKGVSGQHLTGLALDIRNAGHCGGGAPRFNVTTNDNMTHFFGCNTGTRVAEPSAPQTWTKVTWTPAQGFPAVTSTQTIKSISVIFDEGTDTGGGPDFQGFAILDNIQVNNLLLDKD